MQTLNSFKWFQNYSSTWNPNKFKYSCENLTVCLLVAWLIFQSTKNCQINWPLSDICVLSGYNAPAVMQYLWNSVVQWFTYLRVPAYQLLPIHHNNYKTEGQKKPDLCVTNTGDLQEEINKRMGLAAAMNFLWRALWWHLIIVWATKIWVFNTSVIPILLYGSETWPKTQVLAKQLDALNVHCLRMIKCVRWQGHITNKEVQAWTKQTPAHVIMKRCLHWYGHLMHCPSEHLASQCLKFEPAGTGFKRSRGKPWAHRWISLMVTL